MWIIIKNKTNTIFAIHSFILHVNHSYSSAVLSISYDPAEHKMIFFQHGTTPARSVSHIKIWIPFAEKQQLMSASLETLH